MDTRGLSAGKTAPWVRPDPFTREAIEDAGRLAVRRGLIFCVEEGFVDVGPELMKQEGAGVDAHVGYPLVQGVVEGPFWLRIEIGRASCRERVCQYV